MDVGLDQAVDADPVGLEQGGPPPDVGPRVLLDVRDHDQPPLEPLGAVRGEEAYGLAADPPLRQGVGGDLLGGEGGEERLEPGVAAVSLDPGGLVEERQDCVEVAVGGPRGGPARRSVAAAEPLGPRRCRTTGSTAPPATSRRRAVRRGHRRSSAASAAALATGGTCSASPRPARRARRPRRGAGRARRAGSAPPRPAPAVSAARSARARTRTSATSSPASGEASSPFGPDGVEEPGGDGSVSSRCSTAESAETSDLDGGLTHHGGVVRGHLDRDAGRDQGPTQRRDRLAAGPDQDGHVAPRQAVLEVGAAQQVTEVLALGADRWLL